MEASKSKEAVVKTTIYRSAPWHKTLALASLAGFSIFILTIRMYARGIRIDWDVDTFIAISQSWLKGNHLYLDFFDPKWPHIQWLYIPAAVSQSVLVHLATSWLALTGTGVALSLIALQRVGAKKKGLTICAGSIYILIAPLLPGGNIGHLEVYSNFFVALSVYLASSASLNKRLDWLGVGLMTISGLSAGFACGIRPNLAIPTLMLLVTATFYSRLLFGRMRLGIALVLGTVAGILLPFYPYVFVDNGISQAWSGTVEILKPWKEVMYANYTINTFAAELYTMLNPRIFRIGFIAIYSTLLLASIITVLRYSEKKIVVAASLIASWILGLLLSYWISHIHHHYVLMDFLGACIILSYAEVDLSRELHRTLLAISCLMCFVIMAYPLTDASSEDINRLREERIALNYLRNSPSISFAAPEWISLHWKRNQPILTTGIHPAWSIEAAESSKIRSIEAAKRLSIANDLNENCKIWTGSSIDTVFMSKRVAEKCNLTRNPEWADKTTTHGLPVNSKIRLFERQ